MTTSSNTLLTLEMIFTLFIISNFAFLGVTSAAETEHVAFLKRLDVTEALVHTLLNEVEHLKSQEKRQRTQIADMETQLRYQQQRSSYLERVVRKLTVQTREKSFHHTDITPELASDAFRDTRNINRIQRAVNESPVAFFAKMDNHLEHAGVHQTFVFETVVTNVGNAYKDHLGTFIAPVSGIYVFSTTLVSKYHVNAHAQFIKNGNAVTMMYVSGAEAGYDTTSQTIILVLQKGDEVSVENLDSDKSFWGGSHSSFSGFLLQEGLRSPEVVGK